MNTNIAEIAGDSVFQTRIQVALVAKAYDFLTTNSEQTKSYMKKKILADSIVADSRGRVESASWAVANLIPSDFSGTQEDISDQEIVDFINLSWDALAGVVPGDELLSSLPPTVQSLLDMQQTIANLQARLDAANL